MYNIHLLPASFGDSILIEYNEHDPKYILIDGGPYFNFDELINGIQHVAPGLEELELLVISHVDIDHIDGIVTLLNRDKLPFAINEVWFNGWNEIKPFEDAELLGALQGEYLSVAINRHKIPHNKSFGGKTVYVKEIDAPPVIQLPGGMELTLLSPVKEALQKLLPVWEKEVAEKIGDRALIEQRFDEDKRYDQPIDDLLGGMSIEKMQDAKSKGDTSPANGSSIAFIGKYGGKSCLFAADAITDYLLQVIEPILEKNDADKLQLDAWKLAHHGSKKSTLDSLMIKIDCKNMLFSSDGKRYKHPDEQTIAKLLKHNGPDLQLYFNYKTEQNDMWDDVAKQKKYHYDTRYPAKKDEPGITISLM
ncbi:MAG: hypothetical protein H6550_05320 [Chitinophagales bacterium]|nr:hypothetical protein [Chitinophagales bacterium]